MQQRVHRAGTEITREGWNPPPRRRGRRVIQARQSKISAPRSRLESDISLKQPFFATAHEFSTYFSGELSHRNHAEGNRRPAGGRRRGAAVVHQAGTAEFDAAGNL